MNQKQQSSSWSRRQLLWAGAFATLAFLIIVICGYLFGWKWAGLVKAPDFHSRTLWDWLQLLIIPVVIAGGGIWFNQQQRERELKIAREQREQDLRIAEQRTQDTTLQTYLDQMSDLVLGDEADGAKRKPWRKSEGHWEVQVLARARTLTVLQRLDSRRKRSVVDFLYEADLIKGPPPVIELGSPDSHYSTADLSGADLRGATLAGANLGGRISGANLKDADMSGADLHAADLSGADLSGAVGVDRELLEQQGASLEGATMPNGQKYEDWLKDREDRK